MVVDQNVEFWSRSSAVSPQVTEATNPAVGCRYFPSGPRLAYFPSPSHRSSPFGLYQTILLGNIATGLTTRPSQDTSMLQPAAESATTNALVTTTIRFRFDGRSTDYQTSQRSHWRKTGRWPASRSHADLFIYLFIRPQCNSPSPVVTWVVEWS